LKRFDRELAGSVLALPRFAKRVVVMCVDAALGVLAVWLAYYLRVGEFIPLTGNALLAAQIGVALSIPIFMFSGLYRAIFRYSGWPAMLAVAKAVFVYGIVYAAIFTAVSFQDVPRTVGIIQPILLFILVGASRALARVWLGDRYEKILKKVKAPVVIIYGAGAAGRQLAAAMRNSHDMQVAGFVDDDKKLHGHILNGLKIFDPNDLPHLIHTLNVRDVFLALPTLSRARRNEILNSIRELQVAVRTLPAISEIVSGKVGVTDLQELDVDDLLCREPVSPDEKLLRKNIAEKTVLVTGAGGSIGSEISRQILQAGPKCLLLLEQSEYALYAIHQELLANHLNNEIKIIPLLGSVLNERRLREIMGTWHIDTVYHTAAYKHVPLVEHNPVEGLRNNVFGTLTLATTAQEYKIKDFVLISTDKAVRPTNVMGASKRLAEMILQALALESPETNFTMVRFGNVLGSSGSVVPKFREQIKNGDPVSLTHPEITRYFMTIPEAAQLVIQAGAMSAGGDVFVLDMGEPVKIIDLARRMIELSGFSVRDRDNPEGDIEIEITGLRPGEKLYEELLIGSNAEPTVHPRIMFEREVYIPWHELEHKLDDLNYVLSNNDVHEMREILQKLVHGYNPESAIADYVTLEKDRCR
jgi:FlaA1/EpsC-like NDP-sugar epimerase